MAFKKKAGLNRGGNHGPAHCSPRSDQDDFSAPAAPAIRTPEFFADISIADAQSFGLVTLEEVHAAEHMGFAEWRSSGEDFLEIYYFGQRVGLVMGAATARRRHPAFLVFMSGLLERGQS